MALLEFHELLIRDCIAISGSMGVKRIHNPLILNAYIFTYVLSFAHKFHRALEFFKGVCGLSRKKTTKYVNMLPKILEFYGKVLCRFKYLDLVAAVYLG